MAVDAWFVRLYLIFKTEYLSDRLHINNSSSRMSKMSSFILKKRDLREVLVHYFLLKKTAIESHRFVFETYHNYSLSLSIRKKWFRRFRNKDFGVEFKEHGKQLIKFENTESVELLDQDPCQIKKELATALSAIHQCISFYLRAMGLIKKQGSWIS